jgi:FtsP/CotA-like multicopper oxidase with cupredoxin domain
LETSPEIIRFRLLNASSERVINIGFSDNRFSYLIASDGGLIDNAIQGPFMIDNAMFDMAKINHKVKLNSTEIWTLRNQTPIAHPFHIHHGYYWRIFSP